MTNTYYRTRLLIDMTIRIATRYTLALIIGISLVLIAVVPAEEEGVFLKVRELRVKPQKNHRLAQNAIVCNVTDQNSNDYGNIGTKLPSNVTYRINPSSTPSSLSSNLNTIVSNSFNVWDTATNGVTFTKGSNTSTSRARFDGQNIIAWGRLSSSTLGATYIWYSTSTGQVREVDTIMNSRKSWSWTNPASVDEDQTCSSPNAYDAQNILVHELGHWVGLADLYNTSHEDLTMYGYGQLGELKKDTLESGDQLGAGTIYP